MDKNKVMTAMVIVLVLVVGSYTTSDLYDNFVAGIQSSVLSDVLEQTLLFPEG